jgi:hypothetical protein
MFSLRTTLDGGSTTAIPAHLFSDGIFLSPICGVRRTPTSWQAGRQGHAAMDVPTPQNWHDANSRWKLSLLQPPPPFPFQSPLLDHRARGASERHPTAEANMLSGDTVWILSASGTRGARGRSRSRDGDTGGWCPRVSVVRFFFFLFGCFPYVLGCLLQDLGLVDVSLVGPIEEKRPNSWHFESNRPPYVRPDFWNLESPIELVIQFKSKKKEELNCSSKTNFEVASLS